MKKYRVYGTTTVTVTKEVWANNENEAYDKALDQLSCLHVYCGNGGVDKLIGVDGSDESVDAPDVIEYEVRERRRSIKDECDLLAPVCSRLGSNLLKNFSKNKNYAFKTNVLSEITKLKKI